MGSVDQFESMFRAAQREDFQYESIKFDTVWVITDLDAQGAKAFGDTVRGFLPVLSGDSAAVWRDIAGSEFQTAGELLELIESGGQPDSGSRKPNLICTYRNLHSSAWRWPYSLGTHLDLLTQHTDVPVMVLPHPEAQRQAGHAMQKTEKVMAITDHLVGDQRLVNYSVHFTAPGGTLWLSHVEDEITFERYMSAVSRITTIDTDDARQAISRQLLKEPLDYVSGCIKVLREVGLSLTLEKHVTFGRHLKEYQKLIDEHRVDLLVLNTKDEDQLAMHGLAYALAVQLRHIPLLML